MVSSVNSEIARAVLEESLYGNLDNMLDDHEYLITFEAYPNVVKFVLAHYDTGEKYHFVVETRQEEWDSKQALADQEWEE